MISTTTHPSLLKRLGDASDHAAWREFDRRYGDLVLRYCISRGLQHADAEDIRQVVMFSLSKAMPNFLYSPARGRFRSYLGQVAYRAVLEFRQRQRPNRFVIPLEKIEAIVADSESMPADSLWDQEWIGHHYRLAMRTIRATVEPRSVRVFDRLVAGASVAEAASEFGMNEQAVHKIKQRIRDRMRDLIAAQIREENEVGNDRSK